MKEYLNFDPTAFIILFEIHRDRVVFNDLVGNLHHSHENFYNIAPEIG